MSVNPPNPTQHEGYDNAVGEARNLLLEFTGNSAPIYQVCQYFADLSPLALGIFLTSALHGLRDDSFTEVEIATARGEVARHPEPRRLLAGFLGEDEDVAETARLVLPDVPERDLPARSVFLWGPMVDNNTTPYRQHTEDAIAYRDLRRVDWWQLADDIRDGSVAWKGYTEDHDTRGCFACLGPGCLVGYEAELADDEDDGEEEPDREAAFRHKASTMD